MSRRAKQSAASVQHRIGQAILQSTDYEMAKDNRFRRTFTGVNPMGSGADYHIRTEAGYLKMIETARAIVRNNMVVGQAVRRVVDNVLQGGVRVDPDTGDAAIDDRIENLWREWSEDPEQCHAAGELPLHEIAELTLSSAICDGDIFHLPLKSGQLQPVEAHRCRTPQNTTQNVVHGIKLDPITRKRLEYWFTRDDVSPLASVRAVGDVIRYPARDLAGSRQVFHIYMAQRLSQTRGVSALAPAINAIVMHDDIEFATLVQRQVASMFVMIRQRSLDGQYGQAPATGAETDETLSDGSVRTAMDIAPGTEFIAAPGETITGFSPNIPAPGYFEHVKTILTYIAVNLDLPRHVLLLDPSDTNFSGWRGAIDQARLGFQRIQRRMVARFYRPTYQWKLRQWAVTDPQIRDAYATLGPKLFNHYWCPPYWAYIEPETDAKADTAIITNRLDSRRGTLSKRGLDVDEVDTDAANDQGEWIRKCLRKAQEINAEFAEAGVTWRDIDALARDKNAPTPATPQQDPQQQQGKPQ